MIKSCVNLRCAFEWCINVMLIIWYRLTPSTTVSYKACPKRVFLRYINLSSIKGLKVHFREFKYSSLTLPLRVFQIGKKLVSLCALLVV